MKNILTFIILLMSMCALGLSGCEKGEKAEETGCEKVEESGEFVSVVINVYSLPNGKRAMTLNSAGQWEPLQITVTDKKMVDELAAFFPQMNSKHKVPQREICECIAAVHIEFTNSDSRVTNVVIGHYDHYNAGQWPVPPEFAEYITALLKNADTKTDAATIPRDFVSAAICVLDFYGDMDDVFEDGDEEDDDTMYGWSQLLVVTDKKTVNELVAFFPQMYNDHVTPADEQCDCITEFMIRFADVDGKVKSVIVRHYQYYGDGSEWPLSPKFAETILSLLNEHYGETEWPMSPKFAKHFTESLKKAAIAPAEEP